MIIKGLTLNSKRYSIVVWLYVLVVTDPLLKHYIS